MGNAAGELDHLQAPLDVAAAVGHDLAVLGGQQFGQLGHARLDQALELEHHPRPALGIGGGPGGLRLHRDLHGGVQLGRRGQGHAGLDLAGVGVEHLAEAARRPRRGPAVDEMGDVPHGVSSCCSHGRPQDRAVARKTGVMLKAARAGGLFKPET